MERLAMAPTTILENIANGAMNFFKSVFFEVLSQIH
jgi:hypothetical protein